MAFFSRSAIYALVISAAGACVLLSGASSAGQRPERTVDKLEFANAPARITGIKTKKGFVEPGKKFSDDEDWLKNFTVRVKNTYGKGITYVSVMVIFRRPASKEESNEAPFGESIRYGVRPHSNPSASGEAATILPDETAELTWAEGSYDANLTLLERLKYPKSLTKVEVYVEEVGFQDGTVWSGGLFFKPDPNNHGRLIPAEQAAARPVFFE